ncbi:hypothetical protein GS399_17420 [Pedobacter sp. HMF7647]|uniref:Uncharacterized protein n=1 Tax=Hufsiella arboris TaxID=2695275 RepID=A0A7K1YDS3_9SPHI|nr:hypothetical protein [Hufsiella arboris]MXV52756.1 hypothetical protein [Hufsiella arboris]
MRRRLSYIVSFLFLLAFSLQVLLPALTVMVVEGSELKQSFEKDVNAGNKTEDSEAGKEIRELYLHTDLLKLRLPVYRVINIHSVSNDQHRSPSYFPAVPTPPPNRMI